jgi:hypothetical protein
MNQKAVFQENQPYEYWVIANYWIPTHSEAWLEQECKVGDISPTTAIFKASAGSFHLLRFQRFLVWCLLEPLAQTPRDCRKLNLKNAAIAGFRPHLCPTLFIQANKTILNHFKNSFRALSRKIHIFRYNLSSCGPNSTYQGSFERSQRKNCFQLK